MQRRHVTSALIAATIVAAGLTGAREQPPRDLSLTRILQAGRLRIGIDPTYPPFENVDAHGKLDGFDVVLANELARRIGVAAQFVSIDFGSILDGLVARQYDVIVSAASPAPEYAKQIATSPPYFDDGLVVVTRGGTPGSSGSGPARLALGVESGSDGDLQSDALRPLLERRLGPVDFVRYDDVDAEHDSLVRGDIAGAVIDAVTALLWARDVPILAVDRRRLTNDPYVVMARSGDVALLDRVDDVLRSMQADGFARRLESQWLG